MPTRLTKPWRALDDAQASRLPGQLGVYQIADASEQILFMGMAGGRSLFGLRGEVQRELEERDPGRRGDLRFRVEVTMSYLTRYQELLMVYVADHGELPPGNRHGLPVTLGRLHPA